MKKVTAGRDYLGALAPQFAAINDDVLFEQIWSREEELSAKQRSMITISALMGAGIFDQSMKDHLVRGKANGITKKEIVEMATHLAFYTGWPKGWSIFALISEVYEREEETIPNQLFGLGNKLEDSHFNGNVYVKDIFGFDKPMLVDSVTFEPGCRNNWHIHQAGQTLLVTNGQGWYQEAGKPALRLKAGDIVEIPSGVKHWHGATCESWFTHLALEDYTKGEPEWLEAVSDEEYSHLQ